MIKNYFKTAIRILKRNKTYSLINILGLSIGIASSILILLWVTDELSYDRFHKNSGNIYRIVGEDAIVGKMATTCGPLSDYMKDNFPDVVYATKFLPYSGSAFKYNNKVLKIDKGAFVDPTFFDMFSFDFLHGDPKTAFSNISDIIITESMSKKFFGDEDPVGKTLLIDGKDPATISALIKDVPANSQLQFDFVMNSEILKYIGFPLEDWSTAGLNTFIQVQNNTDIQNLNIQIADIMQKQIPGFNRKLFLQPLTGIHLNSDYAYDLPEIGDKKYIFIFSAVALFLILIACINYINLSTASALKKSKEIGLMKMMGMVRFQVIRKFFGESLIIVIISFILGLFLVETLLPLFNQISGKVLAVNYFDLTTLGVIAILLSVVAFLSGGYPALILSSIKPVNALKNILKDGQKGSLFRKVLVVVQFSLSIILIIGTTTVYYQLNFIKNKKLGFEKENILCVAAKGKFLQNYGTIKNELLSESSILDVTSEDRLLINSTQSTTNLFWEGKEDETEVNLEYSYIDYNYFNMLNVEMSEGRNFSQEMGTDQNAFILNQEAVDQMKLKQPIGKRFILNNIEGEIIGVIKNTNFKSLHSKVDPAAYMALSNYSILSFTYNGIILIKTVAGKTQDAISATENIWKIVNPELPFEYHFLDDTIEKQYIKENQTAEIFSYFSLIAIFISCMGLYGLIEFMIENRNKEIGIRKVNGAKVSEVLAMLNKNFVKWVVIAFILATPVSWFIMNKWLENFAYKTTLNCWIFALAGLLTMGIALLTVSFQSYKAATRNPIESLRYE